MNRKPQRPGRAITAAVWLAAATAVPHGRALAQPLHTLFPESRVDWTLLERHGDFHLSYGVADRDLAGRAHWVFVVRGAAPRPGARAVFTLRLSDFGYGPQPVASAGFWLWRWEARAVRPPNAVVLQLEDAEGRVLDLTPGGRTRDYAEYGELAPQDALWESYASVDEALAWDRARGRAPAGGFGPVTGLRLTLAVFDDQEVRVGPIAFGPARGDSGIPPLLYRGLGEDLEPGASLTVDLDGDGVPEVVTPDRAGSKVWRYRARDRAFHPQARNGALGRAAPYHLAVAADLDGDGDPDLVAADPDDRTFHVLLNRRDGFADRSFLVEFPAGPDRAAAPGRTYLSSMALADDDGDVKLDLFLGYLRFDRDSSACVLRLSGRGAGFGPPAPVAATRGPASGSTALQAVLDLDGDGRDDLVTVAAGRGIFAAPGRGDGAFGPAVCLDPLINDGRPRAIAAGDVDGDGRIDLYLPVSGMSRLSNRSDQNRLYLNRGGFRFTEAAGGYGLTGEPVSRDAVFAEVNGRPGPELVVLERNLGVVVYDVAAAGGGTAPADTLRLPSELTAGAHRVAAADLDRDGRTELVVTREEGPTVVRLPDAGPVRTVRLRAPGPGSEGVGAVILFAGGRRLPLVSTDHAAPGPVVVAAGERARVLGGADTVEVPVGAPGGMVTVNFRPRGGGWLRYRAPTWWEIPYAAAARRGVRVAGVLALVGLTGLTWSGWRRATRRNRERMWRELLAGIGLSSHASWRKALVAFTRAVSAGASEEGGEAAGVPRERPRDRLPEAVLEELRGSVKLAAQLDLEGARSAGRAIRELARVHGPGPGPGRPVEAARALESSLRLIQRELAERFSCDLDAVFAGVARFRAAPGTRIERGEGDAELWARFPLREGDAFACLDELVANALKKDPAPGRITVAARARGTQVAVLAVEDDGAPLDRERSREARPGTRRGLDLLAARLRPYGPRVGLEDRPEGGVRAEICVPRFDLD